MKRKSKKKSIKPVTQARAYETIRVILEGAAQVLIDHGYRGLNTNLVAKVAGVSIGSLYQYFPNKDALVVRLIEQQIETDKLTLKKELQGSSTLSPNELIRKLVLTAIDTLAREKELRRVLHEQIPKTEQFQRLLETRKYYHEILKPYFKPAIEKSGRKTEDVIFVAVQALLGVIHDAILDPKEPISREALVSESVTLLLRYVIGEDT